MYIFKIYLTVCVLLIVLTKDSFSIRTIDQLNHFLTDSLDWLTILFVFIIVLILADAFAALYRLRDQEAERALLEEELCLYASVWPWEVPHRHLAWMYWMSLFCLIMTQDLLCLMLVIFTFYVALCLLTEWKGALYTFSYHYRCKTILEALLVAVIVTSLLMVIAWALSTLVFILWVLTFILKWLFFY